MKKYAKGVDTGGVAPGGYASVLALVAALPNLTGDVTAQTISAGMAAMPPTPLPLGGGIIFQCNGTQVTLAPADLLHPGAQGQVHGEGGPGGLQGVRHGELSRSSVDPPKRRDPSSRRTMDQHLIFLLLGLANGAVFASLAMALVVTYRSSGVLNFATGTIALYGAYTYAFLRQGELLVLIPGLPEKVDLGSDLSFWPATLLTLAHHRAARSAALPGRVPAAARRPGGGQGGGVDRRHGRDDRAHGAATRDRARVRGRDPADERLDPRRHPDLERPRVVRRCGPRHRDRDHGCLPLHPLRPAHPRRGRDREGSARQRHRARSHRRR